MCWAKGINTLLLTEVQCTSLGASPRPFWVRILFRVPQSSGLALLLPCLLVLAVSQTSLVFKALVVERVTVRILQTVLSWDASDVHSWQAEALGGREGHLGTSAQGTSPRGQPLGCHPRSSAEAASVRCAHSKVRLDPLHPRFLGRSGRGSGQIISDSLKLENLRGFSGVLLHGEFVCPPSLFAYSLLYLHQCGCVGTYATSGLYPTFPCAARHVPWKPSQLASESLWYTTITVLFFSFFSSASILSVTARYSGVIVHKLWTFF